MIYLTPNKKRVNAVRIVSKTKGNTWDEETVLSRKVFLGYFIEEITMETISDALMESGLLINLLGLYTLETQGRYEIEPFTEWVDEGVIFENVDECIQCLKAGLSPRELYEYTEFASGI
jgi:hypothetical protein